MIRPTTPADTPALLALTEATGVFKPHEVQALDEVLADYHAKNRDDGSLERLSKHAAGPQCHQGDTRHPERHNRVEQVFNDDGAEGVRRVDALPLQQQPL